MDSQISFRVVFSLTLESFSDMTQNLVASDLRFASLILVPRCHLYIKSLSTGHDIVLIQIAFFYRLFHPLRVLLHYR